MRRDNFPKRVSALYQDAVENLRFFKRQQWGVTNYALLIYAAVYFLRCEPFPPLKALLLIVVILTGVASIAVLAQLEGSILWARRRVDRIHVDYFTDPERADLKLEPKAGLLDPFIVILLAFVCGMGAIIIVLLVLYAGCSATPFS